MSGAGNLELGITVGTRCNFQCRHCIVDRNLGRKKISSREVSLQIETINKYHPRSLIFTGGEPTLYIKEITKILSAIDDPNKIRTRIVTNGHFAISPASAEKTLRSFSVLHSVQMSYDKFHAKFAPVTHIYNLFEACAKLNLSFSIVCAIESPLDLVFLNSIKLPGVPITIQKVLSIGNAKKNAIEYRYKRVDGNVFKKTCPNLGKLVYNCGFGFTTCCAFLASASDNRNYVHPTVEIHRRSRFYKLISRFSFGRLLQMSGLPKKNLSPADSDPCVLCSHVIPRILKSENST
ncbi:MAG TPA: hypothetical protein DCL44_04710 [Elusimicrobia bacterium]|nr:hypothetical protein [Elusimicrobiota bacterium]